MADKSIKVTIDIELSKAKSALQSLAKETKNATSELNKTSKEMKSGSVSVGTLAAGFITGQAAYDAFRRSVGIATDFLKSSVEAAGEAGRVQAQLNAVIKSTGNAAGVTADQMIKLSQSLQTQTAYSDEAILSAENLLLTFTNIKGDIIPGVTEVVLDMSTALGQDLKSSAIQVGKALQDPILGISALRRVGVNFTESQQEMIKTMVEAGKSAEAQKYIMAELRKEFGGSAKAEVTTFAGQWKQLNNQFDDMKEEIGNQLIPSLQVLMTTIQVNMPLIIAAFNAAIDVVKKFGEGVDLALGRLPSLFAGIAQYAKAEEDAADAGAKQFQQTADIVLAYNKLNKENKITLDQYQKMDGAQQLAIIRTWAHSQNLQKQAEAQTTVNEVSDDAKKDMEALSSGYQDIIDKSNRFSFESEADFSRFAATLTSTKGKHADFIKSASQGMDAFSAKIEDVNKDIEGLQKKLDDAAESFNQFVTDTNKQGANDFAKIVHDAEKRIPEIQSKLSTPNLSASEQEDLFKELTEKQKIVDTFRTGDLQKNTDFMTELSFLREQDNRNELEQAIALVQQKIDNRTKEFEAEKEKIQGEMAERDKLKSAYIIAQDAMSKALAENVTAREKSYNKEIASANALRDALNAAANAQSRLSGVQSVGATTTIPRFASGGVVTRPTLALVGESGPEKIEPIGRGSGVGGVTININNPSVRSDSDIAEIVRQVNEAFSRRDELAQFGAYK